MPTSGSGESTRVDALTGLRLFAALLVILSHFAPVPDAPATLNVFFASGYNGVTLFFVLSGFVLAWNYSAMEKPSRVATWNFFVARLARVYPLYLAALTFVLVMSHWPWSDWRLIGVHAVALQTWLPRLDHAIALNGPGWSIGVEFFLYACFPGLILLLGKLRSARWLCAIGGMALVGLGAVTALFSWTSLADLPWDSPQSAHRWLYRMPLTRIPDFVIGACLARLVQGMHTPRALRPAAHVQWLSILAFGVLMAWSPLQYSAWSWDFAYLIPSAALIWALASNPRTRIARVLASPAFVSGGEISYSAYLFHVTLIGLVIAQVQPVTAPLWAVSLIATLAVVTLVSGGAHHLLEKPAQRLLRKRLTREVGAG